MTVETANDTALDLLMAMHRLVRSVRRRSAAPGLSPTQLLVLIHLIESGPTRIGELAARVSCSQPTATTVATSLESAGLVRRVPDTSDGRAITLHITDEGRNTLLTIAREQADELRERLAGLDDADRALVLAAVPVLRQMASDSAAAAGSADRRTTNDS
jgi:DNA-binding MarR family transcriptional regulator